MSLSSLLNSHRDFLNQEPVVQTKAMATASNAAASSISESFDGVLGNENKIRAADLLSSRILIIANGLKQSRLRFRKHQANR